MPNEARIHHYIPQCYLRGFSTGSGKKKKVIVANLQARTFFETNPRNVGGIRDFNRIDIPGFKPDALEGMLSGFESEVTEAIKRIEASRTFEGNDKNAALNLLALLAVRSPQQRENWRQFEERLMKNMLGLMLHSKERWEGHLLQMEEDGFELKETLTYEQMVDFYKCDEYDIRLNNEHHIALEFHGHDAVLNALWNRKWRLYFTDERTGHFVTADRPVIITWNEPNSVPPMMRHSPGFGMRETEILFPLTQNALLLGAFEIEDKIVQADTFDVAATNGKVIGYAFEQVYAPKRSFPYIGPGLTYCFDKHFMDRWAELRRKQAAGS